MNSQLALMQLADSFFPSGSFTLSHGLEYLVQTKQVTNSEDLESFLKILLNNKIGTCDLVALIHAYRSSKNNDFVQIEIADRELFCQTLIESNRIAQQKSGRALLRVATATWSSPKLTALQAKVSNKKINCLQPIIFAVVAETAGIGEQDTVFAFLHNLVTSLLGAGIRLGIIGHLQAQKTLLNLAEDLQNTYERAKSLSLEEMWSCTPTIDLAQMQHQKLRSRMFAS